MGGLLLRLEGLLSSAVLAIGTSLNRLWLGPMQF
jgi:hypothetical protein